ncbi:hypothetical protein [Couchioplanes azureus]|uniref:hypothetical protein n=1 Tax=Couchioplanes caeruleus TaxID=56438 RepID=UPI00166F7814|nr:hypothetical protein [Couchioplanes caeruleus]GGQ47908.1 hypothetical protein GCM10010166_15010 [Couchioplanes caeruleus subsp. azureus]
MKISDTTEKVTSSHTVPGAPENVRAQIEHTRGDLGDTVTGITGEANSGSRLRGALSSVKTRTLSGASRVRASAPQRARQAQQAVRSRPAPATATALTVAGAVAAVLIRRRRAAKARAARNRWLPGFLHR